MNVADTELIKSILRRSGYSLSNSLEESITLLCNTCSIRQNAEDKVIRRIKELRATSHRKGLIGIVGCMAKRINLNKCKEYNIDFVVSPDCYRDLPRIIENVHITSIPQISTQSSQTECYDDIYPDCRENSNNNPNAFVSITRGCNNMCSYCIVPFARGRERSRKAQSIIEEFRQMSERVGIRQITLLGQNVNSYYDNSDPNKPVKFSQLIKSLADKHPDIRIKFLSPYPKDFPTELLEIGRAHV